jgi:hypothetical protein
MFLSTKASATALHIADKAFHKLSQDSFSVGHIAWDGDYEWYVSGSHVCRAHRSNVIDLSTGNRIGRVECGIREVANYPSAFSHLGSQFIALCQNGQAVHVGR